MPPPDPHYALLLINHETGEQLKIELVRWRAIVWRGILPPLPGLCLF